MPVYLNDNALNHTRSSHVGSLSRRGLPKQMRTARVYRAFVSLAVQRGAEHPLPAGLPPPSGRGGNATFTNRLVAYGMEATHRAHVHCAGAARSGSQQTRPQCKPDEYYRVTQKQCVSKELNPEFYKPPREPTARTAKPSPRREKVIVCEDEACVQRTEQR